MGPSSRVLLDNFLRWFRNRPLSPRGVVRLFSDVFACVFVCVTIHQVLFSVFLFSRSCSSSGFQQFVNPRALRECSICQPELPRSQPGSQSVWRRVEQFCGGILGPKACSVPKMKTFDGTKKTKNIITQVEVTADRIEVFKAVNVSHFVVTTVKRCHVVSGRAVFIVFSVRLLRLRHFIPRSPSVFPTLNETESKTVTWVFER